MHISEVFKFTEGLGQDGHQIGRKVGDALELLTFGMVERDHQLMEYLVIENGIEGATTAEHKVEFSFYKKNEEGRPSLNPTELFGLIECKKVGVEQTINASYKNWKTSNPVFYESDGYSFKIRATTSSYKWDINIRPNDDVNSNFVCSIIRKDENNRNLDMQQHDLYLNENDRVAIAIDVQDTGA